MLPTYLFIYHLVSSAVPSFPNLFLQLVITVFLQFSKVFPTCWCMLSFDFISFSHQFRENMERSTIFHGKIWKDPQFFMGKYGKIHHFSWETVSRHTWKIFYLWFFGRFEMKNHQNQNARIFFLLGFVSRMYSSLIISFSLCHSATSF